MFFYVSVTTDWFPAVFSVSPEYVKSSSCTLARLLSAQPCLHANQRANRQTSHVFSWSACSSTLLSTSVFPAWSWMNIWKHARSLCMSRLIETVLLLDVSASLCPWPAPSEVVACQTSNIHERVSHIPRARRTELCHQIQLDILLTALGRRGATNWTMSPHRLKTGASAWPIPLTTENERSSPAYSRDRIRIASTICSRIRAPILLVIESESAVELAARPMLN
jgi:hypothetical protein